MLVLDETYRTESGCEHRLRMHKLDHLEDRWCDGRARRFELVYHWTDAEGNVIGAEVQGATWADYRSARKNGLFGHYNLY